MFSEFILHLCDERKSSIHFDVLTFKEVKTHNDERKEAARVRPRGGARAVDFLVLRICPHDDERPTEMDRR